MVRTPLREDSRNEQYCEEINDPEEQSISLKRFIKCPYCDTNNSINFAEKCEKLFEERQMGSQITYEFDWSEYECVECGKVFRIHGSISEYPIGVYNNENINVERHDDYDSD